MQLATQGAGGDGVEMAERLVHEQNIGLDGEGPGDSHPLLHATGELPRVFVDLVAELDHVEILLTTVPGLLAAVLLHEKQIVHHRPPGEETRRLEHITGLGIMVVLGDVTFPELGVSIPLRMLRSVDLPQPEGPTMDTNT